MNFIHEKMVTEYCTWMDKQIGEKFPLSEEQWQQVVDATSKIIHKFPSDIQDDVQKRLFEVISKWDTKDMERKAQLKNV